MQHFIKHVLGNCFSFKGRKDPQVGSIPTKSGMRYPTEPTSTFYVHRKYLKSLELAVEMQSAVSPERNVVSSQG